MFAKEMPWRLISEKGSKCNMENKAPYITPFVTSFAVTVFLIIILFKQNSTVTRLMIIPFIFCALSNALKNLSVMTERLELFEVFKKMETAGFMVFWFGFLCFFCYKVFDSSNKTMLFATIPFWGAGFYIVYKYFVKDIIKKD